MGVSDVYVVIYYIDLFVDCLVSGMCFIVVFILMFVFADAFIILLGCSFSSNSMSSTIISMAIR